ncbi:hypothetical protein Y032_0004g1998 [Ancylostoma ceylanicum]|uniref:Peptidase A1 domain-containing protein n=1 Tax=Ancylostoma ceylanicum TaxID=53326 RepID=A0A016VUU6_9BILA|nr:hypothetical protein Y032_0004g1998 [Ancylostoma ceylanicum]
MRVILAILALLECTLPAVHKMQLRKITPEMIKMLRNGTWAKYIEGMRKQRQHAPRMDGDDDYKHDIISYNDIEYLGEITFGTPEQTFRVLLETSTSYPWIPDKLCYQKPDRPSACQSSQCDIGLICDVFCTEKSCCNLRGNHTTEDPCRRKRRFDMDRSNTYIKTARKFTTWRKRFARGFDGNDTFRFGAEGEDRLVIPGAIIGQAVRIDPCIAHAHFDGVIGLGFVFSSPLLQAIRKGLLDQPIFTVFLKRTRSEDNGYGGMITYGGFDFENCEQPVTYEPVDSVMYWQVRLLGVSAGEYFMVSDAWKAELDTATSFIRGPAAIISAIAKELGAQYDLSNDLYFIECDAPAAVKFLIGTMQYTVGAKNLIIEVQENLCILALSRSSSPEDPPQWIFGYPFIREYCHVFDMSARKVGFAKARQD